MWVRSGTSFSNPHLFLLCKKINLPFKVDYSSGSDEWIRTADLTGMNRLL